MEFSKNVLTEIMEKFKAEKRVFSNEAQFQFELASQLQQRKFRVFFEVLSKIPKLKEDEKEEKLYTDLVIDLGNDEYVAIELKYKTVGRPDTKNAKGFDMAINAFCYGEYNGIRQYIYPQGAVDEGSYGFLKDVERLEGLKDGKIIFNFDNNKVVRQAYAIIVANSKEDTKSAYWYDRSKDVKSNSKSKLPQWVNYNLGQGRVISGELGEWGSKKSTHQSINLHYEYECKWEEYYKDDEQTDYPLKYMIFEIKG